MIARRPAAILLTVAGLAVSAYLTAADVWREQVPLACATSALVNCDVVTSSPQSRIGPIPVAVLGLAWFVGMLAMLAFERRPSVLGSGPLQLAWTAGALLVVLYLVYAELFLIGAICLWCTVVHVLVVLLFLLALARVAGEAPTS